MGNPWMRYVPHHHWDPHSPFHSGGGGPAQANSDRSGPCTTILGKKSATGKHERCLPSRDDSVRNWRRYGAFEVLFRQHEANPDDAVHVVHPRVRVEIIAFEHIGHGRIVSALQEQELGRQACSEAKVPLSALGLYVQ